MPRAVKKSATTPEKDILKLIPASEHQPQPSRLRIGIHTSTAGGVETAAERAWRLGCNLHAEMERAISLRAEYVVLHPGSFRGCTRQEGLANACKAIARASDGLNMADNGLTLLIENTAGAEFSLGSSFESVAELIAALAAHIPVASCIDTCHSHVRGYDIVSEQGYEETMRLLDATVGLANVRVWHCNDAKAACGSKLDRHESIGKGTIGLEAFRRLLHDPRHAHAAFILETPIDEPLDDLHNIETLKSLAG